MQSPAPRLRRHFARILPLVLALLQGAACERRSPPTPPPAAAPAVAQAPPQPVDPWCRGAPRAAVIAPGPGTHLLLGVAADSARRVRLFGIAVVGPAGELGKPAALPPGDTLSNWYARYGLAPGRSFTLLSFGRPAGSALLDSVGLDLGWGRVRGVHTPGVSFLATDLPTDSGAPLWYRARPGERRAVRDLLRDSVRAHIYSWYAEDERKEMRVSAVPLGGDSVALIGSYLEREITAATDYPMMAVFLIADPDGSGGWKTDWFGLWGDPYNEHPYTPSVLEVVDLDGDGIPELVTETDAAIEVTKHSVFKRVQGHWQEVFRSGC